MKNCQRSVTALIACTFLIGCSAGPSQTANVAGAESVEQATVARLAARFVEAPQEAGLLFWSQEDRRYGFKNLEKILSTRPLPAGDRPYPLIDAPQDFSNVTYELDGVTHNLADFLKDPSSIGLAVVKDDRVLLEHYAPGNNRNSRWVSFSVTKSVTSMLIGAAVQDGFIASAEELVVDHLPRFRGTPYERATIRDVLQMASGVKWNEDYADPESDVSRAGGANGITLVNYLRNLPASGNPGDTFNYNTGETNLVGEILRSAIGNNAATYATHKLWQPFGMANDAIWVTGGVGGGELGGCCIAATLLDYARIGIFAMRDGVLPDGTRVLPEGWMAASTSPSRGFEGYGYLWWLGAEGTYLARGIFGQQIFIDPASNLVISVHSNAPTAVGSPYHRHLEAVVQALRAEVTR